MELDIFFGALAMPRQPFLPVHSKSELIYGPGQVKRKPKMAEAVGRCIMTFSYVDWQMAVLLAAIMKTNTEASVAVFLTLKNARARREVLIAAADTTLPDGPNREIFDAIVLIYAGLQSQRADLAHGVFGTIPEGHEDEIPWIEARHLSQAWIERFHLPRSEQGLPISPSKIELDHKRHSFIYQISDLEKFEEDINEFWLTAFTFTSYLVTPWSDIDMKLLQTRCNEPLMAQALSRIRSPQRNPQK